jgi:hypothetical protein
MAIEPMNRKGRFVHFARQKRSESKPRRNN